MLNEYLKELNSLYKKGEIEEVYSDNEKVKNSKRKLPKRRVFKKDFLEMKIEMQELTERYFKKILQNESLKVEYKIGMPFNLSSNPWIMIYSKENEKATSSKSTYMGIDFELESFGEQNKTRVWIGQGITNANKKERIENRIQLVEKMKGVIGETPEHGFKYGPQDDSSGFVIKKEDETSEEFESDVKYLSKKYLAFVEINNSENIENSKNIMVMGNNGLDYIYRKYLNHTDEKYYSLIAYKPGYQLFLSDLGMIMKMAIEKKSKDFYLIIKDIDKYPNEYLQELMILLKRNKDGETQYALNNSYLSNIIFNVEEKKVFIPENLTVFATATNRFSKEIEELFEVIENEQ